MLFPPEQIHSTTEKAHARIEERSIRVIPITPGQVSFPFSNQIFCIRRSFTPIDSRKPPSTETVYGITSLTPQKATSQRLLEYNRGHWSIENKVHHVRDVTMAEDCSRIRKGNGPRILAILRNIALNLLRAAGITNVAEALQRFAYNRHALLSFAGLRRRSSAIMN